MNDFQTAILWWRQLYAELGLAGSATTQGKLGDAAKLRHQSILALLFDLVTEMRIETFLEIGAHEAGVSRHFVHLNKEGRSFAYEPAPAVYRETLDAGIPERMQLLNCAVGLQGGEITFYQPIDDNLREMSSTLRRFGDIDGKPLEVEEFSVPMITLDEVGRRACPAGGRRTALWVDVEGQALDVLRSGIALLKEHVAVVYVEVQDFNTYEGSATSLEVIELLLSLDFVPVTRDNQHTDAWNMLALHESAYRDAREILAHWYRANSGLSTISNWLIDGKFGEPIL